MQDVPAEEGEAAGAFHPDPTPSAVLHAATSPLCGPGAGIPEISLTDIVYDCSSFRDDDILNQHFDIQEEEAAKMPCVGDKEPLTALEAEYQSGSLILLEKIKVLIEQYSAIRRTRGDGNCFFRSFMFSYLEHILETQDKTEVDRIKKRIEECKKTLQTLGYADFTFEDYFESFVELLDTVVIQGEGTSLSDEELLSRTRDRSYSDSIVMFFRFVTTSEIRKRSSFFEPFVMGFTSGSGGSVDQFCKTSVEPMGEESDHIHIIALSDALGVPVRVVYLDRSSCDAGAVKVNHHDFVPASNPDGCTAAGDEPAGGASVKPFLVLLYRPGHYDILYPK